MPNPTFELSEREEQEFLDRILADAGQISPVLNPAQIYGLGYRGLIVKETKPSSGPWSRAKLSADISIVSGLSAPAGALPLEFRLGTAQAQSDQAGSDSATDWLLKLAERKHLAIGDDVWEVLRAGPTLLGQPDTPDRPPEDDAYSAAPDQVEPAPRDATWWACNSPFHAVNHEVFNRP